MGLFNAPRIYPRIYQPYLEQFNFYDGREQWLRSINIIPEKAVNLFSLHWLHAEVYNGGFWQYFFNSTGNSAPEAIRGFAAIGMPKVSLLITSAMAEFGKTYPGSKEVRREMLENFEPEMDFSEFDKQFYDMADTPKFFRRLPKFVPFADCYAMKA